MPNLKSYEQVSMQRLTQMVTKRLIEVSAPPKKEIPTKLVHASIKNCQFTYEIWSIYPQHTMQIYRSNSV